MAQPAGITADAAGNIWVADSRNNRVQKYDAQGNLVATLGRSGGATASFNEPWSVAVDAEGFVYVTDTWNHRVQKFSPGLEPVATWGQPAGQPNPGLLDLFGPRDVVLAPDGTLWVTDTGNKRLLHFSKDGEPIEAFGRDGSALGRFNEPVGLAFDAQGRLYVADAWNGRIQRFDAGFASPVAFPTGWSSQEITAKPYIAVLADGRILATDPAKAVILLLRADGQPAGVWRPESNSQPLGIVALMDGGFAFTDARRNEVQIVPAAAIDRLFR
jgi:DNA-binding beta-propeller fold protein YncE